MILYLAEGKNKYGQKFKETFSTEKEANNYLDNLYCTEKKISKIDI
jgi:hypothetical protein